ncbi:DUF3425 domain-containing protein [Aspergillus novofumigatus IBT 16806]|uniref:Uncharacterized protein n=1 Tax=Aspergillus novofumigatus (strain IBT 16806) TaxID=1392255 RepID=A0A2I1CIV3_ASPN1|nr:uncharacterized protein P174DRAFT_510559 [Aspergillus novofumigatus IBT 16806]PKX97568.1 hypothetical protein P174DRAFT_510559 [Aspergillus novofumigatus IBT 16806]
MPRDTTEDKTQSKSMGKEKRKPVHRDPEKRRYHESGLDFSKDRSGKIWGWEEITDRVFFLGEKLREQLENLEMLAASLAQRSPMTGKIQSESILGDDVWDVSISSSSMTSPKDCQQLLPQSDHTASALNFWNSATHLTSSDNTLSSPNVWDSILRDYTAQPSHSDISPSTLAISDSMKQFPPSKTPLLAPSVWVPPTHMTTTIKCNCSSPHFKVQTHRPSPYSSTEVRILRTGPVTPTPDPYANNLRLDTIYTLAAMDTLRMHISIIEEMMCAKESPSPFYRLLRASIDDLAKENMICIVQRVFMTLKPDLRLSIEQITVEHPPYIDVDKDEFLRDAATGLVCWGRAGVGRKDQDASIGYASTAGKKEWFLKKYWSLLGGEEGELV